MRCAAAVLCAVLVALSVLLCCVMMCCAALCSRKSSARLCCRRVCCCPYIFHQGSASAIVSCCRFGWYCCPSFREIAAERLPILSSRMHCTPPFYTCVLSQLRLPSLSLALFLYLVVVHRAAVVACCSLLLLLLLYRCCAVLARCAAVN